MNKNDQLKVALAQISPVWLNKTATIEKMCQTIKHAVDQNCELIVFGEALLPGYPFWLSLTHGAAFNSTMQKEIHAYYAEQAVVVEQGDLDIICQLAKQHEIAIYLGVIERAMDRGGHSLYCSLIYIDGAGIIQSIHRKLQPTYEERLAWASGDGHGLKTHPLKKFTVGGLNCWENWMPLARTAMYSQGVNVHVAVWPGSQRNTQDITRFIAMESRSFVLSVSGLLRKEDIPNEVPYYNDIVNNAPDVLANGGSCIAGPTGEWLVEPVVHSEAVLVETLDFSRILEERQNFDPAGHYSRPDVLKLELNQDRQSSIEYTSSDNLK